VRDVVPDRVLDQVRHEPGEQPAISHDRGRGERDVEVQVRGGRIDLVAAQRVAGHHGHIDRLATAQPLLPLSQGEQRVDQLLLLLVLLERVATGLPELCGGGRGVGDHHLEQRAGGGQRRAQLVRGVGDEAPLRVVGPFQRAQHPPGHHPAQPTRDQRHDRQRDRRLDLQVVQIGASLAAAHEPDGRLASRRLQGLLDPGRQLGEGFDWPIGGRLTDHVRRDLLGPSGEAGATRIEARGGARDERVGDRQERGAAGQEQAAVEQREPPPDGGLGTTQAIDSVHRPSPIR
jgi:hypothetical protein